MTAETGRWTLARDGAPLYVQLRLELEAALRRGDFPAHRPIPSSRLLAAMYGVSRTTANAALQELTAAGLLVSKPRSGLYPAAPTHRHEATVETDARAVGAPVDWASHLIVGDDPWPTKSVSDPNYLAYPYPFLPGQIIPSSFPTRAWLRAVTQVYDRPHLMYGVRDSADADDPELIGALVRHVLPLKGIDAHPEQVLITGGAQQALSLLAGALLDSGRTVGMENPGYVDAARIFHRSGARVELFPVDSKGVRPDFRRDVDLVYVTPSHQHPTNTTLHADRRAELLREASRRDFLVIEDDFDSEMRYVGSPTRPLRANDTDDRVIYLGTFSKFLAPALRLGYVVAAEPLVAELRERRYLLNKHPSGLDQRALALFISSGDYHRSLRDHRTELRRKWGAVGDALTQHFPWPVDRPSGGLSYWITGPAGFDATAMAARARELGVLVIPGEQYHLQPDPPRNSFRLGFNSIALDRIDRGIQLLGQVLTELVGR